MLSSDRYEEIHTRRKTLLQPPQFWVKHKPYKYSPNTNLRYIHLPKYNMRSSAYDWRTHHRSENPSSIIPITVCRTYGGGGVFVTNTLYAHPRHPDLCNRMPLRIEPLCLSFLERWKLSEEAIQSSPKPHSNTIISLTSAWTLRRLY